MRKNTVSKAIAVILFVAVMVIGIDSCSANTLSDSPASNNSASKPISEKNTSPIIVTWYPNESSNTHGDVRSEVGKLIGQATGRKVEHRLTTDYTIAIEAIASGAADIAMSMGAVGYVEAKNKNPEINVLFVNADKNGKLDEAKYFSWLCVTVENADNYKSGGTYSIDNIRGKKMSFVSNSSTSGFRVPTSSIIAHFTKDNLNEDKLIEGGANLFFSDVYFGGSHQGSAINLITSNVDVAAFCDTELERYVQLDEGIESEVGSVYAIKNNAEAPFNVHSGKKFMVIASYPVFNGPCAYNPKNLSPDEIQAIRDLFTSKEVADNQVLFFDPEAKGAIGLFKKTSSYGYTLTADSWYDPYRR